MLASLVMLASCESSTDAIDTPTPTFGKRLLILNEGGFGKGNSSLDAWSYKDTTETDNVVPGLGDTGNDIKLIDGYIYIVMNESNKIWVLSSDSFKVVTIIPFETDFDPTAIAKTADGEAMVPLLHRDSVAVIDTKNDSIKEYIPTVTSGRGIVVYNGNAYIANDSNGLTIINTTTKAVSYLNNIIINPYDIEVDSARGNIILIGASDFVTGAPPEIGWINSSTNTLTKKIVFGATDYISYYGSFIGNGKLYLLLGNRVEEADLASQSISNANFLPKGYYGGIYDNASNELIFSDAVDYTNNGSIDFYDAATKTKVRTLTGGVIPSRFLIYTR